MCSEWVAILPDGAEPSPDWVSRLDPYMLDLTVGCVGGRVLEFDGPTTDAGWYDGCPGVAWVDWLGTRPLQIRGHPRRTSAPGG